ncbi:MAG: hypothetical protein ACRCVW_07010 [Brevinema sp.]
MQTYNEYKQKLEEIITKMNNSENFEEISTYYVEGTTIIKILEEKLSKSKELIVNIIKK